MTFKTSGYRVSDLFVIPWTDLETMAPNHPDPEQREASRALFLDMLELATRVGAPGMTTLPGIHWPVESYEDSLGRACEELGWRAERARRGDCVLGRASRRIDRADAGAGAAARRGGRRASR